MDIPPLGVTTPTAAYQIFVGPGLLARLPAQLAAWLDMIDTALVERQRLLLHTYGLPTGIPHYPLCPSCPSWI
jgi:hypothetical protein